MRPLLLDNLDSDEHNDDYGQKNKVYEEAKSATRTPRKTPRSIMNEKSGNQKTKSKGLGLLSKGLGFFNKRDNKAGLLQERKELEEKAKREVEM
jgi:hypothetical protein